MAAFSDADVGRLDYALLQNGPISGYFDRRILAEDLRWLREHQYQIDTFDSGSWASKEVAFDELAARLEFPDYFGRNLDALNDSLGELPVPMDSGRVVVLERFDQLYARTPEWAWTLLDVFADQSRSHLLFGERLIVLLRSDDPRLSIRPVGDCPVAWNRREWPSSSRGL
jgi:RNAse (barnase) inhibitor barstar